TADSNIDIHTNNNVLLDGSAAVTGYEGVDFRTRFDGVDTHATSFARATGLFGFVDSNANNTTHLDAAVTGAALARVPAGPRHRGLASAAGDAGAPKRANTASPAPPPSPTDRPTGATSARHDSDSSKRSLAAGGDNGDGTGDAITDPLTFNSDV